MASASPVRYVFTGHPADAYLGGIPARDLTANDYDALDKDQQRTVRDSDLYQAPPDPEPEPVPARATRAVPATHDETKS